MGFLDKAKKLAARGHDEQEGGEPIAEHDTQPQPAAPAQSASPPHGDPLTGPGGVPAAAPGATTPDPGAQPPEPGDRTQGDPLAGPPSRSSASRPASGGWFAAEPPSGADWGPPTPGVPPTEPAGGHTAPVEGSTPPPPAPGVPGVPSSPADDDDPAAG